MFAMNSARSEVGARPARGQTLRTLPRQEFENPTSPEIPILARVRDAAFALDDAHRITYCNSAAEALYGFDAADVEGLTFAQATQCDWPPAVNGADGSPPSSDGWQGQLKQITREGREMLVDVSVALLYDQAKVERFVIVAHEPAAAAQDALAVALDERQRFDVLLCGLSTQFSGLLEEDVDAAIESGLQALVNFLNASRSTLSQVAADGALVVTHTYAAPGVTPYPKGVADDRLPWLVRELRAGRSVVLTKVADLPPEAGHEHEMMTRSGMKAGIAIPLHVGKSLVCVLTFGAFQEERNWPTELISRLRVAGEMFANAIARRQAKEQLELKQRELTHLARVVALSELASVIAHELDQPLTAIVSNAQAGQNFLDQPQPDTAEVKAALADIVADAMRASEIVHRERRLLRKAKPSVELLNFNDAVREIALFIRADAREHGSQVSFRLAPDLPTVLADRVQVQQVVLNLTRNAIQAMSTQRREKRLLYVSTIAGADEAVIAVRDAGAAIDDECLEKMFEPFFTTKSDGLGMGLSISRSLIQAHGGRMWASRNEGPGLTVSVSLPRAPRPK
jgi:PAS domain S-box-containing protein